MAAAKAEREARAQARRLGVTALRIQRAWRGTLARRATRNDLLASWLRDYAPKAADTAAAVGGEELARRVLPPLLLALRPAAGWLAAGGAAPPPPLPPAARNALRGCLALLIRNLSAAAASIGSTTGAAAGPAGQEGSYLCRLVLGDAGTRAAAASQCARLCALLASAIGTGDALLDAAAVRALSLLLLPPPAAGGSDGDATLAAGRAAARGCLAARPEPLLVAMQRLAQPVAEPAAAAPALAAGAAGAARLLEVALCVAEEAATATAVPPGALHGAQSAAEPSDGTVHDAALFLFCNLAQRLCGCPAVAKDPKLRGILAQRLAHSASMYARVTAAACQLSEQRALQPPQAAALLAVLTAAAAHRLAAGASAANAVPPNVPTGTAKAATDAAGSSARNGASAGCAAAPDGGVAAVAAAYSIAAAALLATLSESHGTASRQTPVPSAPAATSAAFNDPNLNPHSNGSNEIAAIEELGRISFLKPLLDALDGGDSETGFEMFAALAFQLVAPVRGCLPVVFLSLNQIAAPDMHAGMYGACSTLLFARHVCVHHALEDRVLPVGYATQAYSSCCGWILNQSGMSAHVASRGNLSPNCCYLMKLNTTFQCY